jgi:putative ABC transport system substrate-binding protein
MKRRSFVAMVGGAAVAWPLAANAQQGERMRRIAILMGYVDGDLEGQARVTAFLEGLQKLGWTQGQNIRLNIGWAGETEATRRLAKEIVALQPDLIFSNNTLTTEELLQQTHTVPILFGGVSDPVGSGFVATLRRPGGNVTGFINTEPPLAGKWVQLLKEIAPRVDHVTLLLSLETASYNESYINSFKAAATSIGVEAIVASVRDNAEIEPVFAAQALGPNGGLVVMPSSFFIAHRAEVISLAARHHLPCVYPFRAFAEQGGLLSYGNDQMDNFRRAASYADRILRGEKPGELPVQAPVKYELVLNLKTANTLGLNVPLSLQQRADEVIE